jgi:multidrug efflux pump
MRFTDIFIKRPVLATVVSLLILLFGLRAIYSLPLRQYPQMQNTVITVATSYPGASSQLVQGFITTPLEKSIASAGGIDYISSTSDLGTSTIEVHIKLNYNPDTAFTDVMSKVQAVMNQLPKAAENPVITKSTGDQIALMYMSFNSDKMTPEQITDYISRVIQPKFETVSGVSQAQIMGGYVFAMRIWLNPKKMAAFNVNSTDIQNALSQNNFQAAAGKTKGVYVAYSIKANTDLTSAKQFRNIVVKSQNGQVVRLADVAKVQLGSDNYDSSVTFNGKKGTFVGITATPTANPLNVIAQIRKMMPRLQKQFPPTLKAHIVYDSTAYIRSAINEVLYTLIEATIIVIIVIFLFLGSIRSVMIPVITIPLSLIGVASLMLALGYSINLLTLLAMVLAIGLVVDDAIVVVENIHRHIDEGIPIFKAAILGAREIATPVIAMTITLAAVYAPIGFMGGMTGALFKEFAFTLASAVIISGVIALTLSPMLCSKVLSRDQGKLATTIDLIFEKIKNFYSRWLHGALNYRPVTAVFAIVILASCYFLYANTQKQLAPTEDQSAIFVLGTAPQYANLNYVTKFTKQMQNIFAKLPETKDYFVVNGMGATNKVIAGEILKPWNERKLTQAKIQPIIQKQLNQIAGLKASAFPLPALPGSGGGLPIQFVVSTTAGGYQQLYQLSQKITNKAKKSGMFIFIDNSLKYNKPQLDININNTKAAELGLSMQDIATTLATNLGGNYVNYFSMENRSYKVIPQILRNYRLNSNDLKNIYIKAANGDMVPLSTIITIKRAVEPNSLTRFQQLNSATIQGVMMPGLSMGTGLAYLQKIANQTLPKGYNYNYSGQSRQFIQEGSALVVALFFAIIIIFLVLAAQFESFRDPCVILISVPMSICGALIPLNLGAASINIYTQIGLITLVGLITKHGILMVEFANKIQQNEGLPIREAIEKAAGIRLRAILMTTLSMVFGVMPLVFATGAGAASRFNIGLVIATGMSIGTIFTLFVVPTMYTFFAKDHTKKIQEDT